MKRRLITPDGCPPNQRIDPATGVCIPVKTQRGGFGSPVPDPLVPINQEIRTLDAALQALTDATR